MVKAGRLFSMEHARKMDGQLDCSVLGCRWQSTGDDDDIQWERSAW